MRSFTRTSSCLKALKIFKLAAPTIRQVQHAINRVVLINPRNTGRLLRGNQGTRKSSGDIYLVKYWSRVIEHTNG